MHKANGRDAGHGRGFQVFGRVVGADASVVLVVVGVLRKNGHHKSNGRDASHYKGVQDFRQEHRHDLAFAFDAAGLMCVSVLLARF